MKWGEGIKAKRVALGLTQYQAAELIKGVDASALSKYERGIYDAMTKTREKIEAAYAEGYLVLRDTLDDVTGRERIAELDRAFPEMAPVPALMPNAVHPHSEARGSK